MSDTPMIFYSLPSDGPEKALVEYNGHYYTVRSGWGEREGWTNNYVATQLTDEQLASPAYSGEQCLEMDEQELAELFDDETLTGMQEAVRKADEDVSPI